MNPFKAVQRFVGRIKAWIAYVWWWLKCLVLCALCGFFVVYVGPLVFPALRGVPALLRAGRSAVAATATTAAAATA